MAARRSRPKSRIARHHAEWMSLIEISGPFLSLPVLERTFPQGLEHDETEHVGDLRLAYDEWRSAQQDGEDRALHRAWVRYVLRRTLELEDEVLREPPDLPPGLDVRIREHQETLRPDFVVVNPKGGDGEEKPRLLVRIVSPNQDLEKPLPKLRWKASPATRMTELLRGSAGGGVPLGLLTNGERWMLVHAPRGETAGFVTWEAPLWFEERPTLRAFRSLLGARRFFGAAEDETLEALLRESAQDQHEVTDQLGFQVRRAVEQLIQSIDRIDRDRDRALLEGYDEKRLYQAAVTLMMRLVFLLYAEEQDLLPLSDPFYAENYAVGTLLGQLQEEADLYGEEVLERRHAAWSRLLATFRAVHGGVEHEAMRLPAYGGSLFDPDRFSFFEGRQRGTDWREAAAAPLPIDDRTVLHMLASIQFLGVKGPGSSGTEPRRLSYKALGVEQIGHVYESLLDHTAVRASGPVIGLKGAKNREPEVAVGELEARKAKGRQPVVDFLVEETGRTRKSLEKDLGYEIPADDASRWITSCDNDDDLFGRVRSWGGLVRYDPGGQPTVIPEGSVYVTQGSDRRTTGTHYTPPSLTEPVVKHTLDPLVYEGPAQGRPEEEWKLRLPSEILGLRVCDFAMGSGAFLVAACRYLAERLVEAWEALETVNAGKILVTPEGDLSEGEPSERLIPVDEAERLAAARRFIADRCLYGVDKDPMAVEMAKLSLWLVTLQKGKPFSFLDHALKNGDSLLGVSRREQIEAFDFATQGESQALLFDQLVNKAMATARDKRERLERVAVNDVRDAEEKGRLLDEADQALEVVRKAADLLTATALSTAGQKRSAYESRRGALAEAFGEAVSDDLDPTTQIERLAKLEGLARKLLDDGKPLAERPRKPFHWPLEFPEVFENGGFDAFVGNPPFMGGQKITGTAGTDFRNYLVDWIAGGSRGSADLCAYMFLRATQLLRATGGFGLIATNTIAQGDTREVGLDRLLEAGCAIPRAVSSQKWPGQANLEVAIVWLRKASWGGPFHLNSENVRGITPQLEVPGRVTGKPYRLASNADKSFQGSNVLGMGFVLTPEQAQALIDKDPRNREVLSPYLNGEDLNSRPDQSPSRWVINFYGWPLERAETYIDCMRIVREKVKPQRDTLADGDATARDRARRWWQFARPTMNLYSTIAGTRRTLVAVQTSKYLSICFQPTNIIFSHTLVIIALDSYSGFAVLNASWHTDWVLKYCSKLETRLRYIPTDGFETFPFPKTTEGLAAIGERYHSHRATVMRERLEGVTRCYNRFHDPADPSEDLARLRELHVELDYAVAAAYGWTDLDLGHGFHETDQGVRFTLSPSARREVLDRLLELNHQRYAEEVAQGLHEKKKPRASRKPRRKSPSAAQAGFFDSSAETLPRATASPTDAAQAILTALRQATRPLSKSQILKATSIPANQWNRAIKPLVDSRRVTKTGERRGTMYSIRAK